MVNGKWWAVTAEWWIVYSECWIANGKWLMLLMVPLSSHKCAPVHKNVHLPADEIVEAKWANPQTPMEYFNRWFTAKNARLLPFAATEGKSDVIPFSFDHLSARVTYSHSNNASQCKTNSFCHRQSLVLCKGSKEDCDFWNAMRDSFTTSLDIVFICATSRTKLSFKWHEMLYKDWQIFSNSSKKLDFLDVRRGAG